MASLAEKRRRYRLSKRTPQEWIELIGTLPYRCLRGSVASTVWWNFAPRDRTCGEPRKRGSYEEWMGIRRAFPYMMNHILTRRRLIEALVSIGLSKRHAESLVREDA